MDNTYTYSIIIPHKNIPKLLQRCLYSIPIRDDVEVIIVDDNSDPSIVDFDHFPGKDRPNTTVIFDKSGKGAGRARNIGLDHAKGKWLLFADADDRFENGLTTVLNGIEKESEDIDIVYYGVVSRDSESLQMTDEASNFNKILKRRDEFSCRYKLLTPWIKATRKSLIDAHDIKFEELLCSNDTWFSALCGYYARNISIIPEIAYCWMQRNGSLWRDRNAEWCIIRYGTCLRIAIFMSDNNNPRAKNLYKENAWDYISDLFSYSPFACFKACLYYSRSFSDWKMWITKVPRLFSYYIKVFINQCLINSNIYV